jgi:hypothetical protein
MTDLTRLSDEEVVDRPRMSMDRLLCCLGLTSVAAVGSSRRQQRLIQSAILKRMNRPETGKETV